MTPFIFKASAGQRMYTFSTKIIYVVDPSIMYRCIFYGICIRIKFVKTLSSSS